MEDCLHTSSENLSKLVSWAHSHGTICSLIPNLKHLLSEGSHGNLTAMWGCSAGHAYHWPLTATCRAGSQERVCFQDNRSFNSDSPSIIGVPSETQTSPVERYPGRAVKAKLDCNRTRDSCDFSYCSEPSELDEAVEEYEDENTLFDMVCESSVTDEDSDFEPQTQRPQSITRKRPGVVPSSLHSSSQTQMVDECSNDVIIKKIKQEIPEDYYIVANAELTGGVDGPALSLTQMAKPKPQTHAGSSCVGAAKLVPHVASAISTELDPHGMSASPSVISRPLVQKTARVSLASPNRGPPGAHGSNQQVAMQMPVSTSHPNKQISIPLSALQLPGQDEQIASEEFLPHLPSQVSSCEVALSPSVNTEPEVSSSQQQPPVAPTITTEATAQCIPDQDERAAELSREQNEKTIRSTQTALRNFPYSTKLNKFPVFNVNDDLNDLCTSAVSPNTTKATRYALNVWRYWCMTNGLKDHTDITKIPAVKLNELLENFYVTVKKSDGSDFLATSLHAIRRGLDRILKNAGVGFSITSSTFSSSTKKLKEKLWVLSKAGMSGARSRNIVYFSLSDEEEMWQAGCLGDDSPITLLSTVVKYNSQYLNMRTLQEHADLMYGDIELLKDPQNQPYFARTDSVKRESRSGSSRVCHGKIYHEHSRGHKQCPYCLLYKYMYIHRPPTQMEAKSPFYLTARKEAADMGSVWYEEQRMGLRSLRGIVPNLAKKVKLENCENFTFVSFTQVSRRLGSHSCCQ
uniref:KIAA1958 n=1 Tax=Oryctolagus cuniculus TaxID=9986 RepID=G1TC73_RABIT